ncbi:PIR Superfamily Protein [Plasmodium ovale wallikeri]|uniref:PIR Superfamily Protein n=1 Tax=Plasmodium ovale wallikeri TaxID=864142 RepID=A0A1A9ARB3_PLAOA|nr:PIR Superfamily Protein [Plasmodium ovale wallikeri]
MVTLNILNENDLPANIFDEKWKAATNFLQFSNAALLQENINNIENWITAFKVKLITIYQDNTLGDISHIQEKRCRDLNYYINYVLYYIPQINENAKNTTEIINNLEEFLSGIFSFWGNLRTQAKFKCKRTKKNYTDKMYLIKLLDDYCENRNSFRTKLKEYNKTTCCKYANHVNEMKRSFHEYITSGQVKGDDESFNIEKNCTLKKFGVTFPNVTCNNDNMSEIETDELQIPHGYEQLTDDQQYMLSGTGQGDSFNTSPTKIALTSVSTLLGACISGLYLYRHSFVGSMLRNFQNKSHISHEETYDDVNGIFSEGPPHYLDNPQENNQFYIAYDSMNN